jgi:hypothetical protein
MPTKNVKNPSTTKLFLPIDCFDSMHPLSLSARCMVLDLVVEEEDDGDDEEDTRYSDAKYVKNNELAISDIIFQRYVCMYVC